MFANCHPMRTYFVPVLATAIVSAAVGMYTPTGPEIATRSEEVMLAASIDTAATAVGVAESSLYYMDQSDLDTAMSEMQSMGVTQVRLLLPWQSMEPTDGTYNWTQADQLLNTAAKYGIAVDADITSSPGWASSASANGIIPNAGPDASADAAYAAFAAAVASRYTSKISAIEVWNEPNGFTGWYPAPSAANYTQLLKDAYTAIKAADPAITVVGGVLGAGVTVGSLTVNPVTFLQQMYAAGAAGFFDALSFHPYDDGGTFSSGTTTANSPIEELEALRALMNANGDAAKLIWATEYGESSADSGGQSQQAAYIQDFLTTWSSLSGVGPMFLYSLIDDVEGDNMGLFTDDWTPKAAVAIVEAWIAAHPAAAPAAAVVGSIVAAVAAVVQAVATAIKSAVSGVANLVHQVTSGIANAVANLVKALTSSKATSTTTATAEATATSKVVAAAVTKTAESKTVKTTAESKTPKTAEVSKTTKTLQATSAAADTPGTAQTAASSASDKVSSAKSKADNKKSDTVGTSKKQRPTRSAQNNTRAGQHAH